MADPLGKVGADLGCIRKLGTCTTLVNLRLDHIRWTEVRAYFFQGHL